MTNYLYLYSSFLQKVQHFYDLLIVYIIKKKKKLFGIKEYILEIGKDYKHFLMISYEVLNETL